MTRRVKAFLFDEQDVLRAIMPNVPKNAVVKSVSYKAEYLGWYIVLEDKNFEPIVEGVQIPVEKIELFK